MKYIIFLLFFCCTPNVIVLKQREESRLEKQRQEFIKQGEKIKADSISKLESKIWDF